MKRQAKNNIAVTVAHKLYATLVNERCANIGKGARIDAEQVASWNVNLNQSRLQNSWCIAVLFCRWVDDGLREMQST